MRFLFTMAWRNLWRHGRRSLITALAMAVGVAVCMAGSAFNDGIYALIFELLVEQSLGHVVVHHPDYPRTQGLFDDIERADERLAALRALPEIRAAAPRVFGFALVAGQQEASGARLVGIDPAAEKLVSPVSERIRTGRYLGDAPEHEVLLGGDLAKSLGVTEGDSVVVVTQAADGSMGNDLYTVVGTYSTGSVAADRSGAYLHIADLRELLVLGDSAHEIVALAKEDDREAIAAFAVDARAALGDGVEVQTWWEAAPAVAQMIDMRGAASAILLGVVFSVAAFGVANTMTMSVMERTRELGVLQAVGMRPSRLVLLVLVESALLGTLACTIGLVLGGALDAWLVVYGLDFSDAIDSFDFMGMKLDPKVHGLVRADSVLMTLFAVFAVSVLASIAPAWRAARMSPVEALKVDA